MPLNVNVESEREYLARRNSYHRAQDYTGVKEPSPYDKARVAIDRQYSDMFRLGKFTDIDKVMSVLYDMWRSPLGQDNCPDCTTENQEAFYKAITRFFPAFDVDKVRKMSSEAKKLDRRPIPGYATNPGQW